MEELKYPVGKFTRPEHISPELIREYISIIETFPAKLKAEVLFLNDEQLDTQYRPDGWTIRQVVNHCADSHINAFIRIKLALTENSPTITAYDQDQWANLSDSKHIPIAPSLQIIEGIHARWTILFKAMKSQDWTKTYIHPEKGRAIPLDEAAASYAWHCRHHLSHITGLKKRMGW